MFFKGEIIMKKILKILKIVVITFLIYGVVFGLLILKWPKYVSSDLNYDANNMVIPSEANSYAYLVETSQEALNVRLGLVEKAEKTIEMIYYQYLDDKAGEIFSGALLKRADEGLEITVIIDGLRPVRKRTHKILAAHENIKFQIYEPLSPIFIHRTHNVLHDKILLIDDNYGLIGGRNIADRFLIEDNDTVTLDRDVLVYSSDEKSEAGIEMKEYFKELKESKYVKNYRVKNKKSFESDKNEMIFKYENYRLENEYNLDLVLSEKGVAVDKVSFIRSPLNRGNKEPVLFNVTKDLFALSDEIVIQSPYITTSRLMKKEFPYDKSKNITFITNNLETNPNPFGISGYIRLRNKLAKNYQVYEHQKENSIHAKTITIGNNISIIGSQNIDHRSFFLSTESAVVILSEDFQNVLNVELENLVNDSLLVNEDGSYAFNENVEPIERTTFKKIKVKVLSWITSLFNELLFKNTQ